jgi:hypothetical protein
MTQSIYSRHKAHVKLLALLLIILGGAFLTAQTNPTSPSLALNARHSNDITGAITITSIHLSFQSLRVNIARSGRFELLSYALASLG